MRGLVRYLFINARLRLEPLPGSQSPHLIAKISGHVENSRAFAHYRDIDEGMAKEVILKLE